ncbi:DUF4168 domain-containing protein [Myxacorys almedinensis]|uniref:DUF4168 domain-containing protein n=1 Tax=Myxacorys almedinensis A TaxID=2690445 RepID=A0A8J7Z8Q7_9CYAN|nr:DUF4168 domain-containing protein [Myxacorys almedinensis]NDJ17505.1 DUF4168 domain-containing protein [Myxacorys almedinensis A]
MLKHILIGGCVIALGFGGALPTQAQTAPTPQAAPAPSVSAADMQKFASAVKQILSISRASEMAAGQAIQGEGLSAQRFDEIYKSQNEPKQKPKTEIQPKERQSYDRAIAKLVQIQQDNETKAAKAVQEQGLNPQQFNQIFQAVRSNPQLRQQVQDMIRAK